MKHRRCYWLLFSGLLLFGLSTQVHAQVDAGSVIGRVTDSSGAVIPGATVTLVNTGTSRTLTRSSQADGLFSFDPVLIGTYSIEVAAHGFGSERKTGIVVQIDQHVKIDFTLKPGSVNQAVEVAGVAPPLQTENASVGQVVTSQQLNDLPLAGRNYTMLAQISAGVTKLVPTRGMDASGSFSANGLSTVHNDYVLDGIDNNNDTVDFLNGNAFVALTPPDALSEVKVQTSNFSAQFGRAGGAVVNATTKSGSNSYHGDLWEYLRNDKLDANSFFANSSGVKKGELRWNQFGFTIGGPIQKNKTFFFGDFEGLLIRQASFHNPTVPTQLQIGSGFTNLSEYLTQESCGAVQDTLGRSFCQGTVLDPATTRAVTAGQVDPVTGLTATANGYVRDPFYTGGSVKGVTDFTTPAQLPLLNQLPAGRIDPNAVKILKLYPTPNLPGLLNNYAVNRTQPTNRSHFDIRVDHDFTGGDQLFGRVSYTNSSADIPGDFTGLGDNAGFGAGKFTDLAFNAAVSETHVFSPTMINELRLGYSRLNTTSQPPYADTAGIPAQFGIQGIPQGNGNGGLPAIDINGLTSIGAGAFASPNNRISNTVQLTENLTKQYGSHTFKGGVEYQAIRFPWIDPPWSRGEFSFGGFTGVPTQSGGVGMADLLLSPGKSTVPNGVDNVGGPGFVAGSNIYHPDDIRHYYGTYFQDDWKVTPNLTVNLGLRWEYFGQIREKYGAQANFIPGTPGSGAEYVLTTQAKNVPLSPAFLSMLQKDGIGLKYSSQPGLINTPLGNFAPRVGFAYQVTPKLVTRGAFGIFYGGFENIGGGPDPGANYPFGVQILTSAPTPWTPIVYGNGQNATLEGGLASMNLSPNSPSFNPEGLSPMALQTPWQTEYTEEYNYAVEYQLTPHQTITLAYVGNQSHHMMNSSQANLPAVLLPPGTDRTPYLPFPDLTPGIGYLANNGDAVYNGLQATFTHQFSRGLQFIGDYTRSSCMTDDRNLLGVSDTDAFRAPGLKGFGVRGDYQKCGNGSPNIFHGSGTWQLPIGRGRRFVSHASGLVNAVVGGWVTNFLVTVQDGFPFSVGCVKSTSSGFGCNADVVAGQDIYAHNGSHGINGYLNPNAFADPPAVTTIGQTDYSPLGGLGTQAYGPMFHRLDFSLFKEFQTSERTHLELRGEFFNLTNTPNFGNPGNLNFTDTKNFAKITSLIDGANDPRQVQLALKLYF